MDDIIEILKNKNIGKIEENVPLKKYTTYRSGGTARCIIYPKNIDKLIDLLTILKANNIKYKILGNGSNLLFSDKPYEGILIKLNEFNDIEFISKNKIRVGAGFSLVKLSMIAAKRSLTGLEFASGIPGTVGGAVFMNAGAYMSDMGYIVETVKVLTPDLKILTLVNKEMNFHYRTSFLKNNPEYICLETTIELKKGKKSAIEEVIRDRRQRRLESQPLEYPSAGSVFRNPADTSAWKLVEGVGLKGKIQGGAMISDKHANFVINFKNAKSEDIKYLIDIAHDEVLKKYGVDLTIEQEFVNWE